MKRESCPGNDWVRGYLESGLAGVPGRDFEYNSMNTYMLSAMVTEITGESLMEYLRPRLWEPMGIRRIFWETCPKGITKGGWGLLSARRMQPSWECCTAERKLEG